MNVRGRDDGAWRGVAAGTCAYVMWGFMPLIFQGIGRHGAGSYEIFAHRVIWSVPVVAALILMRPRTMEGWSAVIRPRSLRLLALSALLLAVNWLAFIVASNSGRVLESSLGYYMIPFVNVAGGIFFFGERIGRTGAAALALAMAGVVLQGLAIGRLPFISLLLALTFGAYGIIRKHVAVDAQVGLLVECLIMLLPAMAYVVWLEGSGDGHFLASAGSTAWLVAAGPLAAIPLILFSWAARQIPLSLMGFLQFISPTISFALGTLQGEPLEPLRLISFAFIWAGVGVFAGGALVSGSKRAR